MKETHLIDPYEGLDMDLVLELSDQDKVLIIDDDIETVQLLKATLIKEGFNVVGALDGNEAISKCGSTKPDVILLDLMMPVMDGWETLRHLREMSNAPVVILSALHQDDNVVRALNQGADDYIRKPFSSKELVARLQTALRRAAPLESVQVLVFPEIGMRINLETHQVFIQEEAIKLTSNEYAVLETLASQPHKPLSYAAISQTVWGDYSPTVQKRLKWLVHQLRRKIAIKSPEQEVIINHPKFGYQFLP